ncbi:PAS domain S-box protein [Hymenobacter nivis]|nr:PAS domain S-box protein [Hymenobacter nivis]
MSPSHTVPPPTPVVPPLPALFDQLGQSYVLADRQGLVVDVNATFLALTGYERAQVLGRSFYRLFVPPSERAAREQAHQDFVQRERLDNGLECAVLTRAGYVRLLRWQGGFARDASGQITGLWLAGQEIADRSASPIALAGHDGSHLQEFLDNAQDLVMHLSADNNLLFVNKAWKEKLGYTDADLAHHSLTDVVHPYYKAKLLYQLRNLYEGEPVNKIETVFLTSTGKPVHLIGSLSAVREPGQPVSGHAILHDITDRIKAERLQKVYYSIANLAISAKNLAALYGAIHRELSKIIETSNLFIALCDDARTELQFAYYVDQHPQPRAHAPRPFSSGISEYVIRGGQPRYITRAEMQQLVQDGTITSFGLMPEVMLASPLSVGERIIGVLVVQDYHRPDAYAPGDLDVLHFISNQVALAIERKRNEEQIQRQNARLNAIFESGSHLMWTVDGRGRLASFNRNYGAYFLRRNGAPATRGLDLRVADLARMDDEPRSIFTQYYQLAETGQPQRFEVRLRDLRGRDLWIEVHLNPIYLGDGSFEEISAIAHDITEQKRAQLALEAQEEKFRSIFESFQDVYYRTDEAGLLTIVSPSVYDVLGYEPHEVLGRPVQDFYYEATTTDRLASLVEHTGGLRNFETAMRHRAGHPVSVLINARRAVQGAPGSEGIARDVTELHQMQDDLRLAKNTAEAALEAKTQFLANMSHELRTPMNGIIGMIDLLNQTVNTDEQREYVDTLRKSSDALLTILNDILDLSKIQAGKMRLQEGALELKAVLERIRSLFLYRAEQKRLVFTYHITPHTPRFIVTDEVRLLQILSNLVANALKFTNEGTVSVVVSSVATDGDYHTVRFAVQDSGIGISSDDASRLFTNFTQLDTTSSKTYGGTGLGLAISRQLSELLGGEIGVFSDTGQGSVFWFTIRCRQAQFEDLPVLLPAAEGPVQAFLTPPHILLVDDNPINQKVGQRLLHKLGCVVDVAIDGPDAIARATALGANYDLIFMDIQMPDMDGITATREIRARLGTGCPPVVAMTAYSMQEDASRFMRQGMDDYVGKPVKTQRLHEVLHRWVRPRPARRTRAVAEPPGPLALLAAPAPTVAPEAVAEPAAGPVPAAPVAAPVVAAPAASLEPVLDVAVLQQLQELGGPEFAADLYREFEEEAGQLLAEAAPLAKTANETNGTALLSPLHQLKGTAATVGAVALAAQARVLEIQLKANPAADVKDNFLVLQHYFVAFTEAYASALALPADAASG